MTSRQWPRPSTADRARRSGGRRRPRPSTPCSDPFRLALRRPVDSAPYCSIEYQAELRKHGVLISMSGKGNGYDNSMVETFFKTLKSELVWRTAFQTRAEASQAPGPLHRRLLQSGPTPLSAGLRQPRPVRKAHRQPIRSPLNRGKSNAAFASPEVYKFLEAEDYGYVIRLP